jgi:hypothetical protein
VRRQRADAPRDIADQTAQLARARAVARGEDAAAADMELSPGVVHSDSRSPEPAECIWQDRAAVVRVVAAVSENETEVVPAFGEGGSYAQVGAEPVQLGSIPN